MHRTLTSLVRPLRTAAVCFALLASTSLIASAAAQAETSISDLLDDAMPTLTGSYLAALSATTSQDYDSAVVFFEEALSQDPENLILLDRTFMLLLANGDVERAIPLAEELVKLNGDNRVGRMALGVKALKAKQYAEAGKQFAQGDKGPLGNISSGLLSAWAAEGQGQTDAALKIVETLQGPEWYSVFKNFNSALINAHAGRTDAALEAITKAYEAETGSMRIAEAYARLMARAGKVDEAKAALEGFTKNSVGHPVIAALLAEIKAGKKPAPLIRTAQDGAAEVLYGLGSALGTESGGADVATLYLRLALYLQPKNELVLMALGDLTQNAQRFERSIPIFDQVAKSSPLRRNAELQIALSYDALGKHDDASKRLKRLIAANPRDIDALTTLATIHRTGKRYGESAAMYTRAINAINDDNARNWLIYFFRGIAYERDKQWDKAEPDFLKALEIQPEEPQVLNYLGYSWIDRGMNLDRATDMIKKAVELKPNDGYIVDSLGWAYYKQGKYEQAVGQLERAISLKADDATINDHLGDAYWKVGRKLEATFQWAHARDLNPEPADKERILAKLAHGLDKVEQTQVASAATGTVSDGTPVVPAQGEPFTVGAGDTLWKIALKVYGDGELYGRLIEANRDKLGNPDNLRPGMILHIPKLETAQ
ncbi:tetratricopeptide repeat protein [Kaistia adipata]|uniref:tetratricopeptide repeat protein n=1 Tax=Kaistia adipata TaxID=166954 RepID=UPI0003F6F9AB|nr:tetratricopeptide repeat protein [Kaistia adipata]